MFKLTTSEDVIADVISDRDVLKVKNAIQVGLMPSRAKPNETTFGFMPFPSYIKPGDEVELSINYDCVVFTLDEKDIPSDFLENYNQVFQKIVTPTSKIIV